MASVLLQKTPYGSFGGQPSGILANTKRDLSPSVTDKEHEEPPLTAEELTKQYAERDAIGPPTVGPISIDPTDWLTPGGLAKVGAILKGIGAPTAAVSTAMLVGSRAAGPASLLARTVGEDQAGILGKLYHGGRPFTEWDPKTVGMGESGQILAQGPGLYAGDTKDLARLYKKYGGKDPALLELEVEDLNIIDPAKKLSDSHRRIVQEAVDRLDEKGLKASSSGLRNSFLNGRFYNKEEVRKALVESGLDGLKQDLHNAYGSEFSIFNPEVIKSIKRIE